MHMGEPTADTLIPQLVCQEESLLSFAKIETSPQDLNILYINIRSLVKKLEELQNIISIIDVDLVIVTESWLREELAPYYNIPGFEAMHTCRKDKRGGGISIFAKHNIEISQCESNMGNAEFMHVVARKGTTSFNIIGVYNYIHTNIKACLEELRPVLERNMPKHLFNW